MALDLDKVCEVGFSVRGNMITAVHIGFALQGAVEVSTAEFGKRGVNGFVDTYLPKLLEQVAVDPQSAKTCFRKKLETMLKEVGNGPPEPANSLRSITGESETEEKPVEASDPAPGSNGADSKVQ